MSALPHFRLWAEVLIFVASAATIWIAGIPLSNYPDISRTGSASAGRSAG